MKTVAIVGLGTMGSAIASRIESQFRVVGLDLGDDVGLVRQADIVILAVKPQSFLTLAKDLKPHIQQQTIVSIMAGVPSTEISENLGTKSVVRTMPNLALAAGQSLTAAFGSTAMKDDIDQLLNTWGEVIWLNDESWFDGFTALAGSGPAYFFQLAAHLQSAAEKLGFDAPTAHTIANGTLRSAAAALGDEQAVAKVQAVASKGGTTEAALAVLDQNKFGEILTQAVLAAAARSKGAVQMTVEKLINAATKAKAVLASSDGAQRNRALRLLSEALKSDMDKALAANAQDVAAAKATRDEAFIDRMTLTKERFNGMVEGVEQVLALPDPVGHIYDAHHQPSGITTSKMRIPLGVILMIYESRPNVTIDAAALALKSGNAIILKGGSETAATNNALEQALHRALKEADLPTGAVQVLTTNARELTTELLSHDEAIDLVIPRGSRRLLEFVSNNSRIPTLLHLEGNCHTYIDAAANVDMAIQVALNAKTQRFGVCNATESLLVHRDIMDKVLPSIAAQLAQKRVEIRGDATVCKMVAGAKLATEEDWGQEYLAPIISIKIVGSLDAAIDHINTYGSGHTDAIITEDQASAKAFLQRVDSASVMHNTSTRLADGFEYGLGAEIGISTSKLHARGPVGLEGLTTYKWIVKSDGVVKN